MDFKVLFLLFIIYSILGWAIEVMDCYILNNKWVNRGFLIGPYCPIYGCGAVLMSLLVSNEHDIISTFLKCMAICSILEYSTSYIMEKMFHTRWWDYSNNKFNINGRICLQTMVLFGLGGIVVIHLGTPAFIFDLNLLNPVAFNILFYLIFILFFADVIVSYNIIRGFKKVTNNIKEDSTEEITLMVKKTLKDKNYFYKRLIISFPDFQSIVKKYDKKLERQKKKIKKDKEKLKKMMNSR